MKRFLITTLLTIFYFTVCSCTQLFAAGGGWRAAGTVDARSYGYQDLAGTDHLWFLPSADLSLYRLGAPYSLHLSGGYLGDNADEFAASGQGRLTSLYLQYGDRMAGSGSARLGRFFLFRGTALGVIDGFEAARTFNRHWSAAVYGGALGPVTRDFALTDPDCSPIFGGQVALTTTGIPYSEVNRFTLSYARQTRDEQLLRNRIALQTWQRLNSQLSWSNRLEGRLEGDFLRRFISRIRWTPPGWSALLEGGVFSPEVADGSWFNGFGEMSYTRLRVDIYRWWSLNRWGAGLDGAVLTAGDRSGIRLGPALSTPYGQAGYRLSAGDRSLVSTPWVNLHYGWGGGLNVYAVASQTTYEWEAMEIESGELTALIAGLKFTPGVTPNTTLTAEYQVYSTPEVTTDRRAQAALIWHFNTRSGR